MANCERLITKARRTPGGLRFAEARQLAECLGAEYSRTKGSHVFYKIPGRRELINLQERNGMAKPYQVRQLLQLIDDQ